MLRAVPVEVFVRLPGFATTLVLVAFGLGPTRLAAQAMEIVPRFVDFTNELVIPAEGERIRCSRRTSDEMLQIQRRGTEWFRPASDWEDLLPRTYYIDLLGSDRTVILQLDRGERPRMLQVRANRDATLGGGTESVTIRFNLVGEPISGIRAVHPRRRRRADPETIVESAIRAEDAVMAVMLARELAHRCEHGIAEPLPEGVIWKRIPPH